MTSADTASKKRSPQRHLRKLVAVLLAGLGVFLIGFGNIWAPEALGLVPDTEFGGWIELFVPFLPMLPIIAAAHITSK
ncbi:MAG: hypothetical protein IID51_13775 [Proteobacteria bacterium]|nr:hypothetical protein [Pseudomonadota bacterium]